MASFFLAAILTVLTALPGTALAFSFSEEAGKDAAQARAKAARTQSLLSEPCKARIKGQKIAVMIAERHQGINNVNSSNQGELFELLNAKLRSVGLATITQGEINARIARAEAEAILNNDPDAAMAASRKLGASFFLKGIISARSGANKMVRANEVAVSIQLTLSDGSGRVLSQVRASGQSWAGSDVVGAAMSVLEDEADSLVAQLYSDFCSKGK
ncbi:hypothetical protein NNJEOMEG_01531 [Fundidesulfovibrio magnetotacticus]|uniref:Curli production assembly/transport component CsgG n=1 Tax=Fundidesulfovibrio magnetotacticus TaxID=2730080 RepID=A0A6V8LVJ8_9BACT|nr:hypothetical protein [Fundidesulfovibrio magnetotacticus]GFK93697.1 hypothetical protein NNJEOMEG_01531 [Fundidesulfovibrio magnetotacticus]